MLFGHTAKVKNNLSLNIDNTNFKTHSYYGDITAPLSLFSSHGTLLQLESCYLILVNIFNTDLDSFVDLVLLKTFQKRNVSSPAPVTIASPSGDIAR